MMKNFCEHALPLLFAALTLGCGLKKYEEIVTCDDLETFLPTEAEPGDIGEDHTSAMETYMSLEGTWEGSFYCTETGETTAFLNISEIAQDSVEFFRGVDQSDCSYLGTAVFEASLSGTSDPDLDGETFFMTGRLSPMEETAYDYSQVFTLEATSDSFVSSVDGISAFSLKIRVDYNGDPIMTKYVSLEPVAGPNGTMSQTQGENCFLEDWIKTE